jgi:spore germination cell wall hydrolase CwlJ-like protein
VARQGFVSVADRAKQLDCLTRNIYWESATEPFEGKVAVAQVTINRVESGKFAPDICGVVYQKNVVYDKVICQFSWFCDGSSKVRPIYPAHWKESRRSGQKSPVRRIPFAQREKRLVLSRRLCQTPVGQTTGS